MEPTFQDHHDLQFWLWACLKAGDDFLAACGQETSVRHRVAGIHTRPHRGIQTVIASEAARFQSEMATKKRLLAQYHFVITAGMSAKVLNRISPLFPQINETYEAAEHFRKEALNLRNLLEDTENIAAAKKGTPRGGWNRKKDLLRELPGSSGGISDATSLIVNDKGHWIGGRLRVEGVLFEVNKIYEAALTIPAPGASPQPPAPGGGAK
ncbi:hypothetical protein [Rhodoblastus sp.]|uniref:hypothetical protein n=1 Tax=Rhodoblastus sp. TaxID=1962975 RepID=UPI003F945C6D